MAYDQVAVESIPVGATVLLKYLPGEAPEPYLATDPHDIPIRYAEVTAAPYRLLAGKVVDGQEHPDVWCLRVTSQDDPEGEAVVSEAGTQFLSVTS